MDKIRYFENIESFKLLAKKEVGQNFLIDYNVCERIVSLLPLVEDSKCLEIGCGAGSLTFFLNECPCEITSIDIDEAMLTKVSADFAANPKMKVIYGNATEFDYSGFDYIVGNLPYYITSLIIEKVLKGATNIKKAVFMVQKEAANRLLSGPKTKDYGPLPIYIALSCKAKREFNVGKFSFVPAPNVDSTVISFDFTNGKHDDVSLKTYKFAEKMFLQRRKTLANNLKGFYPEKVIEELFEHMNLKPMIRPEEIDPNTFRDICLFLETKK